MPSLEEILERPDVAACGRPAAFAVGDYLMREGQDEPAFFVLRSGAVALETHVPQRGAVTVQTLHAGDLLGWSWLVPPFRAAFDARALEPAETTAYDAAGLRERMDADPALGYALLREFVGVVVQRLQHSRIQLLDLYGSER